MSLNHPKFLRETGVVQFQVLLQLVCTTAKGVKQIILLSRRGIRGNLSNLQPIKPTTIMW